MLFYGVMFSNFIYTEKIHYMIVMIYIIGTKFSRFILPTKSVFPTK